MAKQLPSASEAASSWSGGLAAKTDKIRSGIERVSESPGRKAAQQKSVWLANVTAAADKWASNVGALTVEDWRTATLAKVDRVASGAREAESKFAEKIGPVLDHLRAGMAKLDGMPRGDFETNMRRQRAIAEHMHGFRRRG